MEFETEEQQAEAVKRWFREYGLTIILGLVIGLGGMKGYEMYLTSQEQSMADQSAAYSDLLDEFAADADAFKSAVDNYRQEYGVNIYSNLLGLKLAKQAVDSKDLSAAGAVLSQVMQEAVHPVVEHVARQRLVRIQTAEQNYEQALATIAGATGTAFAYSYELLRGDIWMARGDETRARQAYEKARELSADGPQHPDLNMLLAELTHTATEAAASGEVND